MIESRTLSPSSLAFGQLSLVLYIEVVDIYQAPPLFLHALKTFGHEASGMRNFHNHIHFFKATTI